MVNETLVENFCRDQSLYIQELEASNAELLTALKDIDRVASRGDVNTQPLLYYIREKAGAAIRQAKGAAR